MLPGGGVILTSQSCFFVRYPVFSDQFSPNFYVGQIHFGCEEEPRSKPVGVEVQEHDLGWTGEESDLVFCFSPALESEMRRGGWSMTAFQP